MARLSGWNGDRFGRSANPGNDGRNAGKRIRSGLGAIEMGFYVRKSVRVGPFRFNLSKSGVGVSAGVRGFSLGTGPRGNYIHMGRGGLYYRTTLPPGRKVPVPVVSVSDPAFDIPVDEQDSGHEPLRDIESAATEQIVDSSSANLIAELSTKRKKWRIAPFVLVAGAMAAGYVATRTVPSWVLPAVIVVTVLFLLVAVRWDRLRKTTVMLYDLEDDYATICQTLHDAFDDMKNCRKKWHMVSEGKVTDQKRHAGASSSSSASL